MPTPYEEKSWDAVALEKYWRDGLAKYQQGVDKLAPTGSKRAVAFYVSCLAEVDAVRAFTRPECFQSRGLLLAELRRLIAEPTEPSRPVPDIRAYQAAQKGSLESLINQFVGQYERAANKPVERMASGGLFRRLWLRLAAAIVHFFRWA